ncbi:MAG: ParB/RepB/Spo0J family partition protein [Planctomycetota bacterium]|jgi:ParB family chromosome partitioning protein
MMAGKSASGGKSQDRPRLGRGLSSLIVNSAPAPAAASYQTDETVTGKQPRPMEIAVDQIGPNPHQPRKKFDKQQLEELANSIRQQGVLQPLLVAPMAGQATGSQKPYILIAGQRRLLAASRAGLENVPCFIRQADPRQIVEWAIIENIQRADLNAVERAQAYRDVIDRFGLTQAQLAEQMGTSRESVSNYLRILDLCDVVQQLLLSERLTFGHARALASLSGSAARQKALAKKVVADQLSVRQLEALVTADLAGPGGSDTKPKRKPADKAAYIRDLEAQLTRHIGTRVSITPGKKQHTGKLTIDYYSLADFDRILSSLGAAVES